MELLLFEIEHLKRKKIKKYTQNGRSLLSINTIDMAY